MLLTARLLADVASVNQFTTVDVLEWTQGDAPDFYFRTADGSVDKHNIPAGRRYIPPAGATLQVTIQDIDSAVTITREATQPFPEDGSIWKFSFDPVEDADKLPKLVGTYALKLVLTETVGEAEKVITGFVPQALSIARAAPEF